MLTGHNELMLAEFKYGGVPKETFERFVGSQDKPNAFFYWLKKSVWPAAHLPSCPGCLGASNVFRTA